MAIFAENVFAAFKELQDRCGFIPAYAFSGKGSANLFKKLSNEVFAYIFVRDGRPNNADLSISLWIAPPHEPGDGLDKLYVGFKLLIASTFDVDDEFFHSSQQRILNLVPYIQCFTDVILQELIAPAFKTQRYQAYIMERAAFDALKQSTGAQAVIESFSKVARGKRVSYDILAKKATEAAGYLIAEKSLNDEAIAFYGDDASFLGRSLVGLLYAYALTS